MDPDTGSSVRTQVKYTFCSLDVRAYEGSYKFSLDYLMQKFSFEIDLNEMNRINNKIKLQKKNYKINTRFVGGHYLLFNFPLLFLCTIPIFLVNPFLLQYLVFLEICYIEVDTFVILGRQSILLILLSFFCVFIFVSDREANLETIYFTYDLNNDIMLNML